MPTNHHFSKGTISEQYLYEDLIIEAMQIKFGLSLPILTRAPSGARQLIKLSKLNAVQIIENKIKVSDRYLHSISDLKNRLGLNQSNLTIEGYDISHLAGSNAVSSCVRFHEDGPNKKLYRAYNIPSELCGDDVGSLAYTLNRRVLSIQKRPLPNIILIDGGYLQLNAILNVFSSLNIKSPIILSIVKGSNRIRASETILSRDGVIEMPKDSSGFRLLQQVRDESHRFALQASRKKKLKENIETLDGKKVLDMRGVSFTRKDTGLPSSGVIAQEIKEVMPELVDTRDNGYLAVKYDKIVPLLIESIKELKKEIEELKSK